MYDFKDDIIIDRKTRELITLQEMLQNEAVKHSERENEYKNMIKSLQEKLAVTENNIRSEYDRKIAEIAAQEDVLIKSNSELQIKIRFLEHNLALAQNDIKLKESEFAKIQQEKETRTQIETTHLAAEIDWLRKKLGEEISSHTVNVNNKNREMEQLKTSYETELEQVKRESAEKERRIKETEVRMRALQEEKNRRESDKASQIRELTAKVETLNNLHYHERDVYQKEIESKRQEIEALRSSLMEFHVKSEASAAGLRAEFASIKHTFDSIVKSLESQLDEKQRFNMSLEAELANSRALISGQKEQIDGLVAEIERAKTAAKSNNEKEKLLKTVSSKYSFLVKEYDNASKKIQEYQKQIENQQIPPAPAAEPSQEYLCSACGKPVEPDASGCPSCGAAFK